MARTGQVEVTGQVNAGMVNYAASIVLHSGCAVAKMIFKRVLPGTSQWVGSSADIATRLCVLWMDWRCATGLAGRTARNLYIEPKIDMTPGRFAVCIRQSIN